MFILFVVPVMRPTIASTSTLDPQTEREPNGKVSKINHMTSLLSTTV